VPASGARASHGLLASCRRPADMQKQTLCTARHTAPAQQPLLEEGGCAMRMEASGRPPALFLLPEKMALTATNACRCRSSFGVQY